jgi:hypothetical protein
MTAVAGEPLSEGEVAVEGYLDQTDSQRISQKLLTQILSLNFRPFE